MDRKVAARVMDKVDALVRKAEIAAAPLRYTPRDVGRLYKLRVGAYRVIYSLDGGDLTVHAVGHRAEVSKVLKG